MKSTDSRKGKGIPFTSEQLEWLNTPDTSVFTSNMPLLRHMESVSSDPDDTTMSMWFHNDKRISEEEALELLAIHEEVKH